MVFLGLHRIFNKWKVLWPEQFSTFWLSKSQKIWLPSDLLHLWGRTSPIEVVGLQIVDGPRCPSFPMFWCLFSWDYLPNNIEKTTKPGFLRMFSCFPQKKCMDFFGFFPRNMDFSGDFPTFQVPFRCPFLPGLQGPQCRWWSCWRSSPWWSECCGRPVREKEKLLCMYTYIYICILYI